MDIKVPPLGEGADSGTVVSIAVKEGDAVAKDQTIVELENEKAVAPIPSTAAGKVTRVHVKEGDKVAVGQVLISLAGADNGQSPAEPPTAPGAVGGQKPEAKAPAPEAAESPSSVSRPSSFTYKSPTGAPPPASPAIRKTAQQLGIDLRHVRGSERGGRIVMGDLKAYIQGLQQAALSGRSQAPGAAAPAPVSVDFAQWGPVKKEKLSSLRRTIARKMFESWSTIPHVTQFDEADITDLMKLRKKYAAKYEKKGARLTLTSFAIRAVLKALKEFPLFNASLDETTHELVFKNYFHMGIAVDTPEGLIVPVIRDADKKNLLKLSIELQELAEKTRRRKVGADALKGGSFTISNLGGIGGTHFTPIINKPEVAILGLGRGVLKLAPGKEKNEKRIMLPVGVSYDHRVIDGANGARFVRAVCAAFEDFKEKDVKI